MTTPPYPRRFVYEGGPNDGDDFEYTGPEPIMVGMALRTSVDEAGYAYYRCTDRTGTTPGGPATVFVYIGENDDPTKYDTTLS
jgi:hypothetical protein